jgi:hypothetical protein
MASATRASSSIRTVLIQVIANSSQFPKNRFFLGAQHAASHFSKI